MGIGTKKHRIKLTEVGHAMEDLMGNAYKSNYTKEDFKAKYFVFSNRKQVSFLKELFEAFGNPLPQKTSLLQSIITVENSSKFKACSIAYALNFEDK